MNQLELVITFATENVRGKLERTHEWIASRVETARCEAVLAVLRWAASTGQDRLHIGINTALHATLGPILSDLERDIETRVIVDLQFARGRMVAEVAHGLRKTGAISVTVRDAASGAGCGTACDAVRGRIVAGETVRQSLARLTCDKFATALFGVRRSVLHLANQLDIVSDAGAVVGASVGALARMYRGVLEAHWQASRRDVILDASLALSEAVAGFERVDDGCDI